MNLEELDKKIRSDQKKAEKAAAAAQETTGKAEVNEVKKDLRKYFADQCGCDPNEIEWEDDEQDDSDDWAIALSLLSSAMRTLGFYGDARLAGAITQNDQARMDALASEIQQFFLGLNMEEEEEETGEGEVIEGVVDDGGVMHSVIHPKGDQLSGIEVKYEREPQGESQEVHEGVGA